MQGTVESIGLQKKAKRKNQEEIPGMLNQPVNNTSGAPITLRDQAQSRGLQSGTVSKARIKKGY